LPAELKGTLFQAEKKTILVLRDSIVKLSQVNDVDGHRFQ